MVIQLVFAWENLTNAKVSEIQIIYDQAKKTKQDADIDTLWLTNLKHMKEPGVASPKCDGMRQIEESSS